MRRYLRILGILALLFVAGCAAGFTEASYQDELERMGFTGDIIVKKWQENNEPEIITVSYNGCRIDLNVSEEGTISYGETIKPLLNMRQLGDDPILAKECPPVPEPPAPPLPGQVINPE